MVIEQTTPVNYSYSQSQTDLDELNIEDHAQHAEVDPVRSCTLI